MKRGFILVAVLCLFLISVANPSPYIDSCTIADDASVHQEAPFLTAADGDESSESITVFSETLDDDVLFYPDAFLNDTVVVASGGNLYAGSNPVGDYTNTLQVDADYWVVLDASPGEVNYSVYFATPSSIQIEGIRIALYCVESPTLTHDVQDVMIRKDGGVWEDVGDIPTDTLDWVNVSLYGDDYWNTSYVEVGLYLTSAASEAQAIWDYAEVTFYQMHLADSNHFADGFCDVSDWSAESGFAGTITTDGDVANITETTDTYCRMTHTFGSAQDFDGHYLKYRTTATTAESYRVSLYGGTNWFYVEGYGTNLGTKKGYISDATGDSGFDASAVTKIVLAITGDGGTLGIDYLRIGPADAMGFSHDCSTTAGVTDGGGGSSTSDGDELTLTADADGSSFEFAIDTTATAAYLDADYYPMIGLDFNDADSADYIKVESYDGAAWATVIANTTIGTDTLYANCRAADADIEKFRISVNPSANPRLKWFKAFGIANFTLMQGSVATDEVLYVDAGVLKSIKSTGNYIRLQLDYNLGLDSDTYNVWNITTPDTWTGTQVIFRPYNPIAFDDFNTDETRGDWASTGTFNWFYLYFYYVDASISAIKFIEDGTAPAVVRSSSTPNDPSDDEGVMLTAVVTDAVEVYKVYFDAIVSPAGFSDVPYYATEQTDNLWTYEFATLPTGPYVFKIVATDGANENPLTEYAYIELTVREAAITIEEITLAGAGSDFSMMTFSAPKSQRTTRSPPLTQARCQNRASISRGPSSIPPIQMSTSRSSSRIPPSLTTTRASTRSRRLLSRLMVTSLSPRMRSYIPVRRQRHVAGLCT
jgi:hypothetical protein